jgi:putative ABC transport system permease protein
MTRYFLKALGAHFRAGKSLYLLTVVGVALGVASVLSIQIINRNALAAFRGSVTAVSGEADLSVMGRTPSFSESVYPKVLATPGVRAAWPMYRVEVILDEGKESASLTDRLFMEIIGLDFFAPMDIPWRGTSMDLSSPMETSGWAAVTPLMADRMGWEKGGKFKVASGSRQVDLTVGAMVDFQALSPLASPKLIVMDIGQAQDLFGQLGRIHQVDVKLAEGADVYTVQAALEYRLGETVRVVTPAQREQQAEGLMSAFRLNLTALSMISLFVGLFLVYSSTQASLVRRREEFGLLRSIGSTRKQVFWLIIGEVGILGACGVAIGIPLGYWAAQSNVEMVSATLTNLYLLSEISTLELPFWLYGLSAAIGIGGAVSGAVIPALDISRRDTRALLASFTLHEKISSLAPLSFVAGILILILSSLWYLLGGQAWLHAGFVLAVALLVGLPLLAPLMVREICGLIRARSFGFMYSLKGLGVRLQTTAFAVASLAIAVSMLIGITLMIGSFKKTLEVWIGTSIQADIYITPTSWRGKDGGGTLDPDIVETMTDHPSVAAVDRLRGFRAYTGDRRITLAGVEMGLLGGESRFPLISGDTESAYRQVIEEGAVLVGETLARKVNLWAGDLISIFTAKGEVPFSIAGVYYDYSTDGGAVIMDLSTMSRVFDDGPVNSVALYLKEGYDPEVVVDQLKTSLPGSSLQIRSNRRLRTEVFKIFDQTFAITQLLKGMSLLIAVCGITLMLLVLAREQVSELALYRAIGARRSQIFSVYVGKGLGMGLFGLLLGSVGGFLLAGLLIFVINRAYFGWTIQPHFDGWPILQQAATILGAAVIASLYPAIRASRTPATELSRDQ